MMVPPGGLWLNSVSSLAGLFFIVGVVLLLGWAIKHLSGERQKYWGRMLILAAIVLWLIGMTASVAMGGTFGMRGMMDRPSAMTTRGEATSKSSVKSSAKSSAKSSVRRSNSETQGTTETRGTTETKKAPSSRTGSTTERY